VLGTVWSLTSRQDAGLLPAKPDSGNCFTIYHRRLKISLEQEPTPCFAFLGGNSPLTISTTGAIILA
jgi:hypothetical protein